MTIVISIILMRPNGLKNSDMRSFCAGTKEAYSGLKVSANIDNLAACEYCFRGLDLMRFNRRLSYEK